MSKLLNKLLKVDKEATILSESEVLLDDNPITLPVPIVNLALSGSLTGGLNAGVTIFAGESRSFKTSLGLNVMRAFQKKFEDGVVLFLDSEFAITADDIKNFGVDPERVIHIKIRDIEDSKHKIVAFLDKVEVGDKVLVFYDSIGITPAKAEREKALADKIATDMGLRAKEIKSMMRVITPDINLKGIYTIFINHTTQTMDLYPKQYMTGGSGILYSADTVLFLRKNRLDKTKRVNDGTDGKHDNTFKLVTHKSRSIIQDAEFNLDVYANTGINPLTGLEELAKQMKVLEYKGGKYWYWREIDPETGEVLSEDVIEKSTLTEGKFWGKIIRNENFNALINKHFKFSEEIIDESIVERMFESGDDLIETIDDVD